MGSTKRWTTGQMQGAPAEPGPVSRALRSFGGPSGVGVPASVDLTVLHFALFVPGGGPEFAPRPLRRTGSQSGSHLEEVPRVGPWAAHGACRNLTELFFPVRGQRPQAAVELCQRCPVREPCQAYGLSHPAQLGILGGLTVEERRRVRAATRAASKAVRGTEEAPLFSVLEELARYPVMTWGEIARSDDYDAVVQLAFELGARWRPLPPGRWEFDVERDEDGTVLRARLGERDLSMLSRLDPSPADRPTDDDDLSDEMDCADDCVDDCGDDCVDEPRPSEREQVGMHFAVG